MNKRGLLGCVNINMVFMVLEILIITSCNIVDVLPWYFFVLPVFLISILIYKLNLRVNGVVISFLSGFITWTIANMYFNMKYGGDVLEKVGSLLYVNRPIIMIASGVLCGILSSLSFYSGNQMCYFLFSNSNRESN